MSKRKPLKGIASTAVTDTGVVVGLAAGYAEVTVINSGAQSVYAMANALITGVTPSPAVPSAASDFSSFTAAGIVSGGVLIPSGDQWTFRSKESATGGELIEVISFACSAGQSTTVLGGAGEYRKNA